MLGSGRPHPPTPCTPSTLHPPTPVRPSTKPHQLTASTPGCASRPSSSLASATGAWATPHTRAGLNWQTLSGCLMTHWLWAVKQHTFSLLRPEGAADPLPWAAELVWKAWCGVLLTGFTATRRTPAPSQPTSATPHHPTTEMAPRAETTAVAAAAAAAATPTPTPTPTTVPTDRGPLGTERPADWRSCHDGNDDDKKKNKAQTNQPADSQPVSQPGRHGKRGEGLARGTGGGLKPHTRTPIRTGHRRAWHVVGRRAAKDTHAHTHTRTRTHTHAGCCCCTISYLTRPPPATTDARTTGRRPEPACLCAAHSGDPCDRRCLRR